MMGFYAFRNGDERPVGAFTITPGSTTKFLLKGVPLGAQLSLRSNNPARLAMTLVDRHSIDVLQPLAWGQGASDRTTDGLANTEFGQYLVQLSAQKVSDVAAAPTVIVAQASIGGVLGDRAEMWVTTDNALATRLEVLVRAQLNADLPKSLKDQCEYGGVFYRRSRNGAIEHTGSFKGPAQQGTVDIGHKKPNMGCPDGSIPVAWYHTHPFVLNSQGMAYASKEFIEGDSAISDQQQISGYLGVYDGTFWRYDPAPQSRDNFATDVDGRVIPERQGRFIQLDGKLNTKF